MKSKPIVISTARCFACDKRLGRYPAIVQTEDQAQTVYVGQDCFKKVAAQGEVGYQPPKGGPRLFLLGR